MSNQRMPGNVLHTGHQRLATNLILMCYVHSNSDKGWSMHKQVKVQHCGGVG